jgi:hypothetical protein
MRYWYPTQSVRVCVAIAVQNVVDLRVVRRDSHLVYPYVSVDEIFFFRWLQYVSSTFLRNVETNHKYKIEWKLKMTII